MAGDCSIITSHLAFIYPSERELKHLLDCLAHAVQKPSEKIKHVLLTIGVQGSGKSFIGLLASHMFGPDNMWIAESHDLNDGWTASMANRQVLSLEELGIFEKRETYESLKRWITEEAVVVNEKYVPKYTARTPRLIFPHSPTTRHLPPCRKVIAAGGSVGLRPSPRSRAITEGCLVKG